MVQVEAEVKEEWELTRKRYTMKKEPMHRLKQEMKMEVKAEVKKEQMGSEGQQRRRKRDRIPMTRSFGYRLPLWKAQCVDFQKQGKCWAPLRPCCLPGIMLKPNGPPTGFGMTPEHSVRFLIRIIRFESGRFLFFPRRSDAVLRSHVQGEEATLPAVHREREGSQKTGARNTAFRSREALAVPRRGAGEEVTIMFSVTPCMSSLFRTLRPVRSAWCEADVLALR